MDDFSVKNSFKRLYELKVHNSAVSGRCLLVMGEVWKALVSSKVKIFGWRLLLNSLPRKHELCLRGVSNPLLNNLCSLFASFEESSGHLLFSCLFLVRRDKRCSVG